MVSKSISTKIYPPILHPLKEVQLIKFIKKQHTKERLKRHEFYDGMDESIYYAIKDKINFEPDPINDWLRAGYQGAEITFSRDGQMTTILKIRDRQLLVKYSDGEIGIVYSFDDN